MTGNSVWYRVVQEMVMQITTNMVMGYSSGLYSSENDSITYTLYTCFSFLNSYFALRIHRLHLDFTLATFVLFTQLGIRARTSNLRLLIFLRLVYLSLQRVFAKECAFSTGERRNLRRISTRYSFRQVRFLSTVYLSHSFLSRTNNRFIKCTMSSIVFFPILN
jgi:hypothetical protein